MLTRFDEGLWRTPPSSPLVMPRARRSLIQIKELWQCWTPPSTHNIYESFYPKKYSQARIGTVISWGTRSLRLLDCCQTQCDRTQTHLGHCAGSLLQLQANGQPRPSWCIFLTNTQQDRHTSSHGSVWRPLNHTFVRLSDRQVYKKWHSW